MSNKNYLDSLLSLCTDRQKNLFSRIYPDGPKPTQIKHAIFQVENTLKNLNADDEAAKAVKKEAKETVAELSLNLSTTKINLKNTEDELKEAHAVIERLKNPINVENNAIQERLALLDALEAGGVDNWEWYSESISNYRDMAAN